MKKTILNSLFGIIALIIAGCVSPPRATAQPVRVESGVIVYLTNFWSANATAHLNALIALGVKTNSANASRDGWLSSSDWSTFNAKQGALGYTPATNSLAGILAAMGYTPPTNNNSGIVLALGFNPATNTLAGIAAALGYTPPTNTFAGLTNALGYIPATNTVTGILAALGYTPPTNSFAGITNSLKYFPATNSLSGIAAALGYTPPANTFAGITTALTYTPATNSFTGITSALTYTPATNSLAGILAALGYTPQNGSATLTNLSVTGAFTNGIAAGSGISFTTNSGVITIAVTAGGGGSGAADSINPNATLNGTWSVASSLNYFLGATASTDGNIALLGPSSMYWKGTSPGFGLHLGAGATFYAPDGYFTNGVVASTFTGSGASLTGITESGLSFSDNTSRDASTVKHGLLPKLSGDSSQYLNGLGEWTADTTKLAATDGTATNLSVSDSDGKSSIASSFRALLDPAEAIALNWNDRTLNDSGGASAADWANRTLRDSEGNEVIDWENKTFPSGWTLPNESVGTNNAVQAEWNDFIDSRVDGSTESPTNFFGNPATGATTDGAQFGGLTNLTAARLGWSIKQVDSAATNYVISFSGSAVCSILATNNVQLTFTNLVVGGNVGGAVRADGGSRTVSWPTNYITLSTNGLTVAGTNWSISVPSGKVLGFGATVHFSADPTNLVFGACLQP